jgi:nucleotide-binding universal stress UspA family protein
MNRIIVGYDGGGQAADAFALGRLLAGPLEAELTAACVYPSGPGGAEWGEEVRGGAERQLAAIANDGEVRRVAVSSSSAARGLMELAESEHADLLVVGSPDHGKVGDALLGSVARSLLHGAPCAVAVAPKGYDERAVGPPRTIGVGYNASPEAQLALDGAVRLAEACKARLRLIAVIHQRDLFPDAAWLAGLRDYPNAYRRELQLRLEHAVAEAPAKLDARGRVVVGSTSGSLRRAGRRLDLLVLGSRGYGPVKRVLLGSVAGALLRAAPCPVVVWPRGAQLEMEVPHELAAFG